MAAGGQRTGHADAVGIRVGRKDEVGADLVGQLQCQREGAGVLRIRGGDGREAAVVLALFFDDVRVDADPTEGGHHHDVAGAMHVREDDLRCVARNDLGVEDDAGQAREISVFSGGWYREHAGQIRLEVWSNIGGAELAHFGDNRGVMRREHLSAVAEAALKTVVVRGIVTRGDHHAGVGAEMANGEAQLRSRTGTDEKIGFAAEFTPSTGDEFGEVAGEMADVMRDDEAGAWLSGGDMLPESDDRAEDVDVVEAGGADGGTNWHPLRIELVGGRDPADGTAAHATRSKRDTLIETVLDLRPGSAVAEVLEGIDGCGRQGPRAKPVPGIGETGGGNLPLSLGGLKK